MLKSLKLYNPKFGLKELLAIRSVLKSGVLTQGRKVAELEEKFAHYVGAKYAVAVNSCTSAIFLCLQYEKEFNNLKKVKIPSVTFVSVANMIIQSGLKLDFIDEIDVGTCYYLRGTRVIDSAHTLWRNCYVAKSLMCFSFYPTKLLASCEGGMIATDDQKAADWLRKARNNGIERKGMFDWNYNVEFPGFKMTMNDIQAAILLVRLKKLDKYNLQRLKIVEYYRRHFWTTKSVSLHIFPIFSECRNDLMEKLKKNGIQTSVHFKPIHLQPAYNQKKYSLPQSEHWGEHELSIPLHENLSLKDARYIASTIQKNLICRPCHNL